MNSTPIPLKGGSKRAIEGLLSGDLGGSNEAVFEIETAEMIDGNSPKNKIHLVKAWIEIHKEDLMADWDLASGGQPIFKIDPLR